MTAVHTLYIGNSVFEILADSAICPFSFYQYGFIVAHKLVSVQAKQQEFTIAYALAEQVVEQEIDFFQQLRSLHWDRIPVVSQSGQ